MSTRPAAMMISLVLLRAWATTCGAVIAAENATVARPYGPEQHRTVDNGTPRTVAVVDTSKLGDSVPGPAAISNGTDSGREAYDDDGISVKRGDHVPPSGGVDGPAKDLSDVVRRVDRGLAAMEGNSSRSARQVEQRDQRCALQELQQVSVGDGGGGGGSGGDDDDETVLEATRTVDRYRLRPVASSYVSPVVYRERPATGAALYVRRRRPVLVLNRAQQKPITAAASYYFEEPAVDVVAMHTMRGPPLSIGLPYVQRVVVDDRHQTAGKRDDDVGVSLMPDDVRRLLQRVFSEGVIAGEAAATVPKLAKDHPPTG